MCIYIEKERENVCVYRAYFIRGGVVTKVSGRGWGGGGGLRG